MSYSKLLNKLCSIQTKTEVQNATGSVTLSWADAYVSVPCRYNRMSEGRGSVLAGVLQVTLEDFIFFFNVTTVISEADRISVDGRYFEVLHVYKDGSDHHLEVYAKDRTYE